MALSLKDEETDRLARAVAAMTGETLTEAVRVALAERLVRERLRRGAAPRLADRLMDIGRHCAALPDDDTRTPEEIVGYDATGMWRWMVVDTSAIVAILFGESDATRYATAIGEASELLVSAVTRVELSCVVEGRKGDAGRADLERLLQDGAFEIVAVTPRQAAVAIEAFRRFGRGRHRAGLNIGDCFAYALAAVTEHPLLFKGDDFGHTNIRSALSGE